MKLFFIILMLSSSAFAWDSAKCSKMLNDGLYKKYEWGGVGDHNVNAMTKETKKSGSSTATAKISTEGSTAVLDPGYSTNVTRSETQSTSSWGECSLFGLKERKAQREAFVAQNLDQIKIEAAKGQGPFLESLAWLSLCESGTNSKFDLILQDNFQQVFADGNQVPQALDRIIQESFQLQQKCFNFNDI